MEKFEHLLQESKYDETETQFLINGFKEGFSIGYEGDPSTVKITSNNLRFREVGNELQLWNKVMKEVKMK